MAKETRTHKLCEKHPLIATVLALVMNSFSANILNGITKLIAVFGDQLNDEIFKEKVGAISVKQLVRTAKERHAGSMGCAEAMLIEYNGKKKNPAQRLSMNKLHARESSIFSGLYDLEEQDDSAEKEDNSLFDELEKLKRSTGAS